MGVVNSSSTLYPASVDASMCKYASVNSSYPLTNPIGKASSNTTYSQWNLTTGSNAESYVFYKFDCSAIPADATINSVTCSAKGYVSQTNSSRINTRQMQLYSGTTTAKGSAGTISTSTTALTLTAGTWTRAELDNCYIRIYVKRGTSNTTTTYYARFYGATLTISYSYREVDYVVTTTLNGNGTIDPQGRTEIYDGDAFSLKITPDDKSENVSVTDNGVNVTSSLVKTSLPSNETLAKAIASAALTGNINGTNYNSAIGKSGDTSTSVPSGNDRCSTNGQTAYISFGFDLSAIPQDATITKVSCQVRGKAQTTSSYYSNKKYELQLYSGTTAKGSAVSFSSTSAQTVTLSNTGTWTREELDDLTLRFTIAYYGGVVAGATLTIEYTDPTGGGVYYTYSPSVKESKDIVVTISSEPNAEVTISHSGKGSVTPEGNVSITAGGNLVINIVPEDSNSKITVHHNGVDVSSQLEDVVASPTYEVATKSGATYGFQQNYDANCRDGWWQSTNKAKATSASVSTVSFSCTKTTQVKVRCICYAESTYDYFLIGGMDASLSTSASADSSAVFNTKNSNSQNEQSYTFANVPAGNHTFDVKYFKDSYTDSNWDSAQFIVEFDPSNGDTGAKTYTINDLHGNHTIVVTISGESIYLKVNGAWKEAKALYKKVNGAWVVISPSEIDLTKKYKMN